MTESTSFARAQAGTGARRPAGAQPAPEITAGDDGDVEGLARERPRGRSFVERPDWGRASTIGIGLAIGLALGAGIALLAAPMSGAETREMIGRGARRLRHRASDEWDDLRDELRAIGRKGRRRVRRSVTRGKWAAEDAVDRVGRRRR